jgi:hypothetical protein
VRHADTQAGEWRARQNGRTNFYVIEISMIFSAHRKWGQGAELIAMSTVISVFG